MKIPRNVNTFWINVFVQHYNNSSIPDDPNIHNFLILELLRCCIATTSLLPKMVVKEAKEKGGKEVEAIFIIFEAWRCSWRHGCGVWQAYYQRCPHLVIDSANPMDTYPTLWIANGGHILLQIYKESVPCFSVCVKQLTKNTVWHQQALIVAPLRRFSECVFLRIFTSGQFYNCSFLFHFFCLRCGWIWYCCANECRRRCLVGCFAWPGVTNGAFRQENLICPLKFMIRLWFSYFHAFGFGISGR